MIVMAEIEQYQSFNFDNENLEEFLKIVDEALAQSYESELSQSLQESVLSQSFQTLQYSDQIDVYSTSWESQGMVTRFLHS